MTLGARFKTAGHEVLTYIISEKDLPILVKTVSTFQPDLIIFLQRKAIQVFQSELDNGRDWFGQIRKVSKAKIFYWILSDPHYSFILHVNDRFKQLFRHIDIVLSNCSSSDHIYHRLGAGFKFLPLYGNTQFFHPEESFTPEEIKLFTSDVGFAGHPHPIDHYRGSRFLREEIFYEVIKQNILFKLYGSGWSHFSTRVWIKNSDGRHGRWSLETVNKIYQITKINLGLNVYMTPGYLNAKPFEVGAAGGFLLMENIGGLADLFDIGKELVVFDTKKELIEKIRYYMAHEDERLEIAANLHKRVMRDYTFKDLAQKFIDIYSEVTADE